MRENIGLYRGKRIDNGEWIEGFYAQSGERAYIIIDNSFAVGYVTMKEVIPSTVGQFTGLPDKNGELIFEGDVFRMDEDDIAVVVFKDGCFRLEIHGLCGTFTESGFDECGGGYGVIECDPIDWYCVRDMKVIGNIHDNSELLTVN